MEMFNSCTSGLEEKLQILNVLKAACRLPRGRKSLCESYGMVSWLYGAVKENLTVSKVIEIVNEIVQDGTEDFLQINSILVHVIDAGIVKDLQRKDLNLFLQVVVLCWDKQSQFLTEDRLAVLTSCAKDMGEGDSYILELRSKWLAVKKS